MYIKKRNIDENNVYTVINQKPQKLIAYYKSLSFFSPPHDDEDGNPAGM